MVFNFKGIIIPKRLAIDKREDSGLIRQIIFAKIIFAMADATY